MDGMDLDKKAELRLWALIEDPSERVPLLTLNETRAAMQLLQVLALGDGFGSDIAHQLAASIARRLPSEE